MKLHGTLTALVTPFRDGRVDHAAFEALVMRQIESGVDGLVPCGTTGESPTLSEEEQSDLVKACVRLAQGRVPVIAGSGTNCTAKTIALCRRNAELGADALLVVNPYYNRPSQEGLLRHFAAVAAAVDRPIMLYNIPGRCAVELSVDTVRRLREKCANIVSIKHATGSVAGAADLLSVCDIEVVSGDDPLTLPLMSLGGVGVVSVIANLAPRTTRAMTQAALQGEWATARRLNAQLHVLAKSLMSLDTNPVPIKAALAERGLCRDELRLPLCPLSAEARAALRKLLAAQPLE